jgi:uncharacterized protein (DUF3084 family)
MGTVLAIGLLVGVCGLIAYIGDLLGRRMGKRRLSLWGLRPRHTAVLFTVVTGMLIAVFSLFVLVGLSAGIRRAVLHGEALLRENRQLRREQLVLRGEIRKQRSDNAELVAREIGLKSEVSRLDEELQLRTRRNARLRSQRALLEAKIEGLNRTQKGLEARERDLQARNGHLQDGYREAKTRLAGAQQQLRIVRRDLEAAQSDLQKAMIERQKQVNELGATLIKLRARELELADEQIIARANEELARVVLVPGADRRRLRETVEGVMRRAEQEVRNRHRAAGSSAPPQLVVWQPRWAAPSDIVNTLVSWMETHNEPLVLRVVTDENAPAGSTVTARLATAPRRLAFRPGEEIAAATLDGRKSEGELLRSLLGFLQGTVRRQALRRSVLPAGDGRVGEIPYEPLLATIKQVREVGGPARVSAVAATEIQSEGPLHLDFRVLRWEERVAGDP